ncbi:MAG: AraC family transcriptional regulator [bacterium]
MLCSKYPLDLDNRIEKAKELLKTSNGKYRLYEIANKVGLSLRHLSRTFKKNNSKSFNHLCIEIKMEYAKKLLKNTNLTIDQIAYEVGYSHWSSFTRRFKERVKYSPIEYRRMNK